MQSYNFEGKNKIDAIAKAASELKCNEDDLIVEILEENVGIVKKVTRIRVVKLSELTNFIKDKIKEITSLMNLDVNLEVRRRENSLTIKMFSDNNNILIGKGGKTVESLQTIIRTTVSNLVETPLSIVLDVENYKEKRVKHLEFLARRIAPAQVP